MTVAVIRRRFGTSSREHGSGCANYRAKTRRKPPGTCSSFRSESRAKRRCRGATSCVPSWPSTPGLKQL